MVPSYYCYGIKVCSQKHVQKIGHTIYVIVKNYTFIAYLGKHILASYTNNSALAFTLKKLLHHTQ